MLKSWKLLDKLAEYRKSLTTWDTAWKVSKYGVISGPYFPAFGLKTGKSLSIFSPNAGKYGPEITPYLDTFHAVGALARHGLDTKFFTTNFLQTFGKAKKSNRYFRERIILILLFNFLNFFRELKIFFMNILIPRYKKKCQKQ